MCEWFDEGPCCSNAIVVDTMNVHHSFGCSSDLMMSDWFVRNLWLGNEPSVKPDADEPEWIRWLGDTETSPMFCESQKSRAIHVWTKETIVEAREHLARLGDPEDDSKDKDALEETLEVLAWAERNLAAGLDILCAHDF